MRNLNISLIFLFFTLNANLFAENYLLNGGQESKIQYTLIQDIQPTTETVTVDLTFVVPQSFKSATYKQIISDFNITCTKNPEKKENWIDARGNKVIKYSWIKPSESLKVTINFTAKNSVALNSIVTNAVFPPTNIPDEAKVFLSGTRQVQVESETIINKSAQLVKDAKTQFDAVQKILSWIIDHMHYVLTPEEFDALYAFESGKGNCQNYSHLAAALMRAAGIPTRIVNGVTLKRPFDINMGNQVLTLNMAQGRHSWIEVYFPDLGWMPFDPQQTELFVSNRFIRIEVGLDNNETLNDGLVHWTRQKGSTKVLAFQESIEADFLEDNIAISGKREVYGPQKLLLSPFVDANFIPLKIPEIKPPLKYTPDQLRELKFEQPVIYGNLEFPEGVNFLFVRESKESMDEQGHELQKNFLVETAEYVTSSLQYGQTFILDKPVRLQKIGLALQKFGGEGQLWLELREDNDGIPGEIAATSSRIDLQQISSKPGYTWLDFDFNTQFLILTPDRYWISLAYSGTPIVNWFYSYGKPVGPIDGTRYKSFSENSWGNSLGYEFNYRVIGLTPVGSLQ